MGGSIISGGVPIFQKILDRGVHILWGSKYSVTDLRLSKVKPMGARWMVNLHDHLKAKPDMIRDAFKAAGILNYHL